LVLAAPQPAIRERLWAVGIPGPVREAIAHDSLLEDVVGARGHRQGSLELRDAVRAGLHLRERPPRQDPIERVLPYRIGGTQERGGGPVATRQLETSLLDQDLRLHPEIRSA
jgi:hypothetical protein